MHSGGITVPRKFNHWDDMAVPPLFVIEAVEAQQNCSCQDCPARDRSHSSTATDVSEHINKQMLASTTLCEETKKGTVSQ